MNLLREYIRELLTEGMRQPADLPHGHVVVVSEVEPGYMEFYYGNSDGEAIGNPMGTVEIEKLDRLKVGNCGGAWTVGGSGADQGWGPMLYDVAIEWATLNGEGLISDRSSVSGEAKGVWQYYMQNRGDVTAHQLDDPFNSLTPEDEDNCDQEVAGGGHLMYGGDKDFGSDWVNSSLSKRYTKSPTTMRELKRTGKLVQL
tara:strand:- start:1326 stop:1925 length:600 start_codon:yes stop_codon:yes gene_type:complete